MNKLVCKNFTVIIDGAERVSSVNIDVEGGEIVALLGPNGSGKSSLLKGIMSQTGCDISGTLFFDGEDITNLEIHNKAKKGIFFSPQHTPILEGVKLISLLYGAYTKIAGNSSISILELRKQSIAIAQKYGINPDLLDRSVGVGLSGGEKKQAELLQLLVLKPKVCLLDEIDSGVDVGMVEKLRNTLNDLQKEGCAIILISHNIHLLDSLNINKVYVLEAGKIIQSGDGSLVNIIKKNGF